MLRQHEDILDLGQAEVCSAPGDVDVPEGLIVLLRNEVRRLFLGLSEATERQHAIDVRHFVR